MRKLEQFVNFDSEESKRELYAVLKKMSGFKLVTIRDSKATDQQRKFYFVAIVTPLAEHTGNEPLATHRHLKGRFLKELSVFEGTVSWQLMELDMLDAAEFSDYIENCIRFLAERWDIIVKDADEYLADIASKKEKYLKKVQSILDGIGDEECMVDNGKMYFKSGRTLPQFYSAPLKNQYKELTFHQTTEVKGLRVIKFGGNCYQLRVPESLFPHKGLHKIFFDQNNTITIYP